MLHQQQYQSLVRPSVPAASLRSQPAACGYSPVPASSLRSCRPSSRSSLWSLLPAYGPSLQPAATVQSLRLASGPTVRPYRSFLQAGLHSQLRAARLVLLVCVPLTRTDSSRSSRRTQTTRSQKTTVGPNTIHFLTLISASGLSNNKRIASIRTLQLVPKHISSVVAHSRVVPVHSSLSVGQHRCMPSLARHQLVSHILG